MTDAIYDRGQRELANELDAILKQHHVCAINTMDRVTKIRILGDALNSIEVVIERVRGQ